MDKKEQMEKAIKNMQKRIDKTYKPSLWHRFKDAIGIIFLAVVFLLCLFGIVYIFITIIENPVSLAIICATIILVFLIIRRDL